MARQLSQENIILVEELIKNQPSSNINGIAISYRDQADAIRYFNEISNPNVKPTSYYIFASNAMGFISFGYYKSVDGKIYIIRTFIEKLKKYYKVDETWAFLQRPE